MEHGFRRTEERYSTCNKGSNGDKDMENRLGIEGVEGDHGLNGRSSPGTRTLTYVKQIAGGNVLHDSGNSNGGLVTT